MLHLDFETRSEAELGGATGVGLHNYFLHPSTQNLMLAWGFGLEEPQLWLPQEGSMPNRLYKGLKDESEELAAFNSPFERYDLQYLLDIKIPASRFQDPQASARYLSLPANLEDVGMVLGLPRELQKDKRGEQLLDLFSYPKKRKKKEGGGTYFNDHNSHPAEFAQLGEYCKQDIVAEREIARRLSLLKVYPLPPREREIWIFDQKVNDRGMPTDRKFVTSMFKIAEKNKLEKLEEQNKATGLENANSATQLLPWVQERGYPLSNLRKQNIELILKSKTDGMEEGSVPGMSDECRGVLEARMEASSTSYKKLQAILRNLSPDDYLRNQFIYMGSSRCGRWSGNAVQLHNLARPDGTFEDMENVTKARNFIYEDDYYNLKTAFKDEKKDRFYSPLIIAKNLIRTVFVAPEGKRFNVCDLNAIETRVAAWVSQCQPLLDVFANGKDPYLDLATKMTGIPYDKLAADIKSKDNKIKALAKRHRQVAKPGVLGCFGAGTNVLTSRGWVRIVDITSSDLIFDGIEWVKHDGIIDKGVKDVVDLYGVSVTPNHEILIESNIWRTAWDVVQNFLLGKQALSLATGLLLQANTKRDLDTTTFATADAVKESLFVNKISNAGKLAHVSSVQWTRFKRILIQFMHDSLNTRESLLTGSQTDTMQLSLGAAKGDTRDTLVGVSSASSRMFTHLSNTVLRWRTLINKNIKSTEQTITETMRLAICGLLHALSIMPIKSVTVSSRISDENTLPQISGRNLLRNIEMSGISLDRYAKDSPQNKSYQTNRNAAVRTYDILNCGPRTRFMILTDQGPLIVHNSVYRLGGGGWGVDKNGDRIKTGLWGYAEAMGVDMTQEQAHEVVRIFREAYREIVETWYALEEAVKDVLKEGTTRVKRELGPGGCIKIDKLTIENRDPILRIQLPSGRYLHYLDASIQDIKMPWKNRETGEDVYKPGLVYFGMDQDTKRWTAIVSHGGKTFENIVQGIARDALADKLLEFEEIGLAVCGHFHDEGAALSDDDPFAPGVLEMEAIMNRPVKWAITLPLGSDGFESDFYHK